MIIKELLKTLVKPKKLNKISFSMVESQANKFGVYVSKPKLGLCKNEGCFNARRQGSSFCQKCSDKHNQK